MWLRGSGNEGAVLREGGEFRNTERDYRGEMDGGGTAKRHGQYSFLV